MAERRVSDTSFSAAVSVTLTQSITGISGARAKASATNEVTGNGTDGSRSAA